MTSRIAERLNHASSEASSLIEKMDAEIERLRGAMSLAADYLEAGFKNKLDPQAFSKALETIGDALRPLSSTK